MLCQYFIEREERGSGERWRAHACVGFVCRLVGDLLKLSAYLIARSSLQKCDFVNVETHTVIKCFPLYGSEEGKKSSFIHLLGGQCELKEIFFFLSFFWDQFHFHGQHGSDNGAWICARSFGKMLKSN